MTRKILTILLALLPSFLHAQQVVNVPPSTQPSSVLVQVPPTVIQMQPAPTPPATRMAIGTNVPSNDYINGVGAWNDVTKKMTGWFGAAGGNITGWDANGYPTGVSGPGSARAFTYLYADPPGVYTVTWVGGQNALTFTGGKVIGNVQPNGPNGWTGTVSFNTGDRCELQQQGGVTDIHILRPDASPLRTFTDQYIEKLKPYKVLRLMPLQHVNGDGLPPTMHPINGGSQWNPQWQYRTTPTQWSQTNAEIALEYQAELCRETGCIPWLCLPYLVDDATVAQVAQVFATFPMVYVEYGNENWNTSPAYQGNWIRNDAIAMGTYFSNDPNVAGARRAAELTARAGKIFKATIGANRVKTVFGGQAAWDAWVANGLGWLKPGDVDAVAIAPYFQPADSLINPTVPQILTSCDKWIQTVLVPGIRANYAAASKYGVPLWAYEGGQHLLPVTKAPAVELQWQGDLTPAQWAVYQQDPFRLAQFDGGMGTIYDHLFTACRDNGVSLACHFMVVSNFGRSGWWGLTQQTTDPPTPKSQALDRWIAAGN